MTLAGWLPVPAAQLFGAGVTAEEAYGLLTVDVPPADWISALRTARDDLGCTYFDWLSAVDEPGTGFRVCAHVVALAPVRRLMLRTTVPHEAPALPTAVGVYAGAAWHERETHEMFGVAFEGHPGLDHLLLPEGFEGHPLRKEFVLAARVAKAWPGAKEPGESTGEHGGPRRRQMLPPGVPDPNEWGPLKGQLPPAPARPARAAGRPAGDRPSAADRPARRARTAAQGSTGQTPRTPAPAPAPAAQPQAPGARPEAPDETETPGTGTPDPGTPGADAASDVGVASEAGDVGAANAPDASAPARPAGPRRSRSVSEGSATQRTQPPVTRPEPPARQGGSDAPWHHARPTFDEQDEQGEQDQQNEQRDRPTEEQPTEDAPSGDSPSTDAPPANPPAEDSSSADSPSGDTPSDDGGRQ